MTPRRNAHRPHGLHARVWLVACVAVLASWMLAPTASAQVLLNVRDANLELVDNVYQLDLQSDIELPADARKAIESGLTLHLDYEIELARVRSYLPDAGTAALVQSYEIVYHAVTQRYLLRNLNTGEQTDVGTLQAALDQVANVNGLPVLDAGLVEPGRLYEARVRAVLDMGNAPEALRWMLFWTDDWSGSSEWYVWKLRP